VQIGQVLDLSPALTLLSQPTELGAALLIVGPPDSGKSVLTHALFQTLLQSGVDAYLQRAQWDGEGNYILEAATGWNEAEQEQFKALNRGQLTEQFFPYHAQAILKLRRQKPLVIVDVGGMVQPEKQPILEACSHYLVISSTPEAIAPWHEFCRDRGNLKLLGIIHSRLEETEILHQTAPYLELTAGPWIRGQTASIPPALLAAVQSIVRSGAPSTS
jgi:CRISPR-associated protein Csx3